MVRSMPRYPKLKNFWFQERAERALVAIMKHHNLATQAEAIRFLINQEVKRLEGTENASH